VKSSSFLMCHDSQPEDYLRSRSRWYDLPAVLLYHRPMRCQYCERRYYGLRKRRRPGPIRSLWMHYLIVLGLIFLIAGPGYSALQQTLAQLIPPGNSTPTGSSSIQPTP
jgi:hypothetical protein